jgi:putative PIN family toxin of toxin-antitoxin system
VIRVVIDTNLYVSALIKENSRNKLNLVLENQLVEILIDITLIAELHEVIMRPKFKNYVSKTQIDSFLELINERCVFVVTSSNVTHSPDPKDDFLLALCQDGHSDYLLAGNKVDCWI